MLLIKQGLKEKKLKEFIYKKHTISKKEFYLSCLVDRESSKIAFISSTEGGVDIESVAKNNPEKIITTKVEFKDNISNEDIQKIIKIYSLDTNQKKDAKNLVNALFNILVSKDASLMKLIHLLLQSKKNLFV